MNSTLREILIIIIGILIAFALNSGYEHFKNKQSVKEHLDSIHDEVQQNIAALTVALPYHDSLLKVIETDPSNADIILKAPHITDISWQLAQDKTLGR